MLEVKDCVTLVLLPETTDVRVIMVPIVLSGTSVVSVLLVVLPKMTEVRVVKEPIVLSELLGVSAVTVVLLEMLSVCGVPTALLEMIEVDEGTGRRLVSVGVSSVVVAAVVVELWGELVHPSGESEQLLIVRLLVGCNDCSVAGTRTTTYVVPPITDLKVD